MKIKKHEYHTNSSYILEIDGKNGKEELLVEYHYQEIIVNENYEIHHPVDSAHYEPSESKHFIFIEKVNKIIDESIDIELFLSAEECEIIENYISYAKQSEW
tara:strand:+ start:145 stop:450 length:306 start_codon:yes stop_codon:yes gene_type:complete